MNKTDTTLEGQFSITKLSNGGFAVSSLDKSSSNYWKTYFSTYDKNGNVILNKTMIISENSYTYDQSLIQITNNKLAIAYVASNGSYNACNTQAKILDLSTGAILNFINLSCGVSYSETNTIMQINPISNLAFVAWNAYISDENDHIQPYAVFDFDGNIIKTCTLLDSSVNRKYSMRPYINCLANGTCLFYYGIMNSQNITIVQQVVANSSGDFLGQQTAVYNSDSVPFMSSIAYHDNSYVFFYLNYTDYYQYATFYSSFGENIFSGLYCNSSKILTIGKLACANPIINCATYKDDTTCNACTSPYKVTMNGVSCAPPITNCLIYSDDMTCHTCQDNFALSQTKANCLSASVSGCSVYSEEGACSTCSGTKILSLTGRTCVNKILNCSDHKDDGSCQVCGNSTILSVDNKTCANPIGHCLNYTNDQKCISCDNITILSEDKWVCAFPIDNCLTYSDKKNCSVCLSPYVLTIQKTACADPLADCVAYTEDKNCSSCMDNKFVSISKRKCVKSIPYCLLYSDDSTCLLCGNSTILSISNYSCVFPIANCSSVNDHLKCMNCINNTILTGGEYACAIPIMDCEIYSDDKTCSDCLNNKVLTLNKTACVAPISNCDSYFDNGLCESCSENFAITVGKKACVNPIKFCLQYSDDEKCLACQFHKVLTINQKNCSDFIQYCIAYSIDNNGCNLCRDGTDITQNNVCILNFTKSQLPDIERKSVISNISVNISTKTEGKYLSISNLQTIEINNQYTDYELSLNKNEVNFLISNSEALSVPILLSDDSEPGLFIISVNVSSLNSGSYSILLEIVFSLKARILQDDTKLPAFFVVSYQDPNQYFIGTDEQIQNEQSKKLFFGFDAKLFAILISIFVFLLIVILVMVIAKICKKKQSLLETKNKSSSAFEAVPSIPPSDFVIDEEIKGREHTITGSPSSTEKQLYDSQNKL